MNVFQRLAKRALDVIVALAVLTVALVPMAVVALLVRIFLGVPVLFRQMRPGLHAKTFEIWKFRSMTEERGADGRLLPEAKRTTKFGQLLRRSSLDELPQLINVLRGDLSLVGPRPLLIEYLPLYTPEQARRHDVKPGITGLAQVNGRNAISWEEKLAYDVWYVEHQSVALDLKILLLTAAKVLRREGIDGHGNRAFTGNTAAGETESLHANRTEQA